jgi:hypothetical protein
MGISEAILGEIIQRILSVCHPTRVILFGSAAAGTMNPDSDIDLLHHVPSGWTSPVRKVTGGKAAGKRGWKLVCIRLDLSV